jgi:hypothetical protein
VWVRRKDWPLWKGRHSLNEPRHFSRHRSLSERAGQESKANSFASISAGLASLRSSVLKTIWPSIRAKGAPKQ